MFKVSVNATLLHSTSIYLAMINKGSFLSGNLHSHMTLSHISHMTLVLDKIGLRGALRSNCIKILIWGSPFFIYEYRIIKQI